MSISLLPVEVLELIFQNLDGRTFCLAKQVSTTWLSVIRKLQKNPKLWQKFCMKEIDKSLLEDLLSSKSIPMCNYIINWVDVYRRWFQGHLVKRKSFVVRRISAYDSNPVTCIKASGPWVITGHSSGCFCVWDQKDGKFWQIYSCHLKAITDIALVDLLNLGTYCGPEDFIWSHHHMITVSKDFCIKVTSLLELDLNDDSNSQSRCQVFNKHGDVINFLRVFNTQFAAASRDNTVTLWNMEILKYPFFNLKITFLHSIIGPADILQTLGFWHNQIYCITYAGKLKTYEPDDWEESAYLKKFITQFSKKKLTITSYYAFRKRVVLMFSACGKMIVTLGEGLHQAYPLFQTLQTNVVCATLSGSTLALGGENGKLYLFRAPTDESLLTLDLHQPDFERLLSVASIVCVDVLYDRDSLVVAASSTESLFLVRWPADRTAPREVE